MTMQQKKSNSKRALAGGGGLGSGIVLVWAWNSLMPDNQMPAEVGSAVGGALMGLAMWAKDLIEEAAQ